MFDEIFLEDVHEDWLWSLPSLGLYSGFEDGFFIDASLIGDVKGTAADFLADLPTYARLVDVVSDVDEAADLAVAQLPPETDFFTRPTQGPLGIFSGRGYSAVPPLDLATDEQWGAFISRVLESENDLETSDKVLENLRKSLGQTTTTWPAYFVFDGEPKRWEKMVSVENYDGWEIGEPDFRSKFWKIVHFGGIPKTVFDTKAARNWLNSVKTKIDDFSGIAVGGFVAKTDASKRRTVVQDVRLVLVDHFEVAEKQRARVPVYDSASPAQSLLRAKTATLLIDGLDLPPHWSTDDQERFKETLRLAHTPLRAEGDPAPSEDALEFVRELLAPFHTSLPRVHGTPSLPHSRLIKNARAAEEYAAEVMTALGYQEVKVTPVGPDGGVDVTAREAVAQVKMEAVTTGRPIVQALYGIASLEGKVGLVFSLAGYTQDAVAWADRAGVACFEFELDGSIAGRGKVADVLLRLGAGAI